MNLKYSTSFVVYPDHTNTKSPLIFGGAFFSQIDKAADVAVRRFLYESDSSETAVTHIHEGKFLKPCYLGDLIFLEAEILTTGVKSIVVEVKSYRERVKNKEINRELVAITQFVFVTLSINEDNINDKPDLLSYCHHGMKIE